MGSNMNENLRTTKITKRETRHTSPVFCYATVQKIFLESKGKTVLLRV